MWEYTLWINFCSDCVLNAQWNAEFVKRQLILGFLIYKRDFPSKVMLWDQTLTMWKIRWENMLRDSSHNFA